MWYEHVERGREGKEKEVELNSKCSKEVERSSREQMINMQGFLYPLKKKRPTQQISKRQSCFWMKRFICRDRGSWSSWKYWDRDSRAGHRSPLFCRIVLPPSWGPGRFSMDLSLLFSLSLPCSLQTVDLLSHTLKCSLLLHTFQILLFSPLSSSQVSLFLVSPGSTFWVIRLLFIFDPGESRCVLCSGLCGGWTGTWICSYCWGTSVSSPVLTFIKGQDSVSTLFKVNGINSSHRRRTHQASTRCSLERCGKTLVWAVIDAYCVQFNFCFRTVSVMSAPSSCIFSILAWRIFRAYALLTVFPGCTLLVFANSGRTFVFRHCMGHLILLPFSSHLSILSSQPLQIRIHPSICSESTYIKR